MRPRHTCERNRGRRGRGKPSGGGGLRKARAGGRRLLRGSPARLSPAAGRAEGTRARATVPAADPRWGAGCGVRRAHSRAVLLHAPSQPVFPRPRPQNRSARRLSHGQKPPSALRLPTAPQQQGASTARSSPNLPALASARCPNGRKNGKKKKRRRQKKVAVARRGQTPPSRDGGDADGEGSSVRDGEGSSARPVPLPPGRRQLSAPAASRG